MKEHAHTNIRVAVHDAATGKRLSEHRTHNTVCQGYHKFLTRLANPEEPLRIRDVDYELALGEDNTTAPSYSNSALNSQIAQTNVSDFINDGTNLYTSTFIDSTEANPTDGSAYQSIVEIGIKAITPDKTYLCNHSTINEIQKTDQKTCTIESTLELNDDTNDA